MKTTWNKAVLVTSTVLCLFAENAVTDDEQQRFEITPLLGYVTGGPFMAHQAYERIPHRRSDCRRFETVLDENDFGSTQISFYT